MASVVWENLQINKFIIFRVAGVLIIFVASVIILVNKPWNKSEKNNPSKNSEAVVVPSIINGNLVLPDISSSSGNLTPNLSGSRLNVVSANLIPVFDQQTQKLAGIRILGETSNIGTKIVDTISPVIRFYNKDGVSISQKVGHLSSGFVFPTVGSGETTVYDITVDSPPESDKLEIVINAGSTIEKPIFETLKIASRSMEVKFATYQGDKLSTESADTNRPDEIEYYTVSGSIVNGTVDPLTEITVYVWVRDSENKIFSFSKQEFRDDLLQSNDKLDFKIRLFPLKDGEKYDTYEILAKGKRYKLN